jgi:hypothetical protein
VFIYFGTSERKIGNVRDNEHERRTQLPGHGILFWKRPTAAVNARINDNNTSYDKAELEAKDHHCHQVTELDSCQQNVNAHPRSAHPHGHQVPDETEDSPSLNHSPSSHLNSANARSGLP